MKSRTMMFRTKDKAYYTGNRQILGSFLSANTDNECFGSLRIPKSFCEAFGCQLSSNVIIKCKKIAWKAIFDQGKNRIYGLKSFMRFYEIKLYNLIQFDYYGENLFVVSIYRDAAVECKYPTTDVEEFFKNEDITSWNEDEYVIDCSTMEYQKSHELWLFNAYKNCFSYFHINIRKDDIDQKRKKLILSPDLENLYKDWKDGDKLFLSFGEDFYVIDVHRKDGKCMLGKGWYDFWQISNIKVGDTLVLFKLPESENNRVHACLFQTKLEEFDEDKVSKEWKRGFFKVVSESFLDGGVMVVPREIKEVYKQKLIHTKTIEVNGESWFICYNYIGGYVTNLKQMIDHFSLREKDTIIFSMNRSKVMFARIYQEDGKEIDYATRKFEKTNPAISTWLWDVTCIRKSDSDENNESEEQNVRKLDIAESSNQMRGGNEVYPAFIIGFKPIQIDTGKMTLPSEIILDYGDEIPPSVGLHLPSGREVHVRYNKKAKCFEYMDRFLKEIRIHNGSMFVFNYNGDGNFLVNVLDDNASEIVYPSLRSLGKNSIFDIDNNSGIGIKFLVIINGDTHISGQVVIPESFSGRFGKLIPENVTFALKSGDVFEGHYIQNDKKLNGLLPIIGLQYIQRKDFVLFTYRGSGRFDMMIFDNSKVEKNIEPDVDEEEMDVEEMDAEQNGIDAQQMNNAYLTFEVCLTWSNVNNTSHGVHIPRTITPHDRKWKAGERVLLRTNNGSWDVGIVYNNGLPRFSAGWNLFSEDNGLQLNQTLVFTFVEDDNGIAFDIQLP